MKFRVLQGKHSEGLKETRKVYKRGDVVDSNIDLEKKFNRGSRKFERVHADEAVAVAEAPSTLDELEKMTKADLEAFATEGGIEISGLRTKDQLIVAIREAMA